MSIDGSVSHWIRLLKAGELVAVQPLWERYFQQLVERARQRLGRTPRRAADEEDIALSAFDSFCRAAADGRFPRLDDRHDLWQLLLMVTERKVIDLVQYESRAKRSGRVLDEWTLTARGESGGKLPLDCLAGREPDPGLVAQVAEEYSRLLGLLGDTELRAVAEWKLEGYTIEEIAAKLGCVPRTVDRRLRLIRSIWEKEMTR